jgi:hypothetical protein
MKWDGIPHLTMLEKAPFFRFFHVSSGRRAAKRKDPKYLTASPGIGRADVLRAILAEEH